jgi:anaphase-promoting complex subunit 8
MKDFFLASLYQKLRMHKESLSKYEYLLGIFGYSNYIQAQIAKGHYSLREFDQVERIFEELLRTDPYRVEDLDMYSNVLYTKECFSALSCLAHRVLMIDKYSPESCCIIGNYYSSKGKHEESVKYFSRALKLNKNYASAWTLMGHEFIELKNIAAAVNAYRQAVEIDEGDYRAWYGLGQAYELTGMPLFALKYYKESVSRQPNDPRLWIAMAKCYENDQFRMLDKAIKCYERAANYNDSEAIALHQLAKLHSELGCPEKAAFYYRKDLEKMESEERDGPNMVEAWIYLAKYYKSTKRFEEAEVYCTRLLDYTGLVSQIFNHTLNLFYNIDTFNLKQFFHTELFNDQNHSFRRGRQQRVYLERFDQHSLQRLLITFLHNVFCSARVFPCLCYGLNNNPNFVIF